MVPKDEVATSEASSRSLSKTERKKTKKKPKKHKAQTPATDTGDHANLHKVVVKQLSSSSIRRTELKRAASSSVVVPTADGRNEQPERPGTQTYGYATGAYRMLLETREAEVLCESVMLQYSQLAHLRKLFDAEDTLHTDVITQEEFFTIIGEEKRKLSQGIFEFVGLEKNVKRLKFDDFVVCVITFSALSRPELLHYAFTLFDQDASGAMDERELIAFCGDLKNKGFFFEKNVQIAQKKLVGGSGAYGKHDGRALNDGLVDYEDIASGSAQFPAAFYPILQFQRNIRAATLGEPFWAKVAERKQRIEVLVHYMRLNEGHLPPLSIRDYFKAVFNREEYGLRKIAVVKYADEKRVWELERENEAAAAAASTQTVESGD